MSVAMSWLLLLVGACFEVAWILGLKYTEGFTVLIPSLLTASAMAVSFFLLAIAIKKIPVGTAYACFTGIGAAGGAFFGMWFFGESSDFMRIVCILCIIIGVLGLKYYSRNNNNA